MSRNFTTRKSTLLAIALGLSALGSTTMPAAAMPGRIFFGPSAIVIPHFGGGIPGRIIRNFNGPVYLPEMPSAATRIIGNVNTPVTQAPVQNPTGTRITGNVDTPVTIPAQKPDTGPSGTRIIGSLNDKPAQLPSPTPPVAQAPAAAAPNTAAAQPCNCLTKQYLDDGSVLFRDICTREAAMATQAELQAQSQAAAR